MSVSVVSKELYPNRLNQAKAVGLLLAVAFKNYALHIPEAFTPEVTEEEYAEILRQGHQEFGRLSVKFGLNDPKFDQLLDPAPRTTASLETERL